MTIGRVYQNTTNTTFTFSSHKYYSEKFIETFFDDDENNKKVISKIISVNSINKRFNTPDFIRYIEEDEIFNNEALYIYTAVEIACIDTTNQTAINQYYPHFPGQRVFKTDNESIKLAYNLGDDGIEIGYLENINGNKISADLDKIFNPHLTVLGRTGSGKTYFISKLIPKIIDSSVYVFSPTSEYNDIHDLNRNFKLLEKNDIVLNYKVENLSYYYGLNMSEERILSSIQMEKKKVYTNNDLIKLIQKHYEKKTISSASYHQISFLDNKDRVTTIPIEDIQFPQYALSLMDKLKKRNLKFIYDSKYDLPNSAIFDLSNVARIEQECVLDAFLYKIYTRQKNTNTDKRKKCYIFFEEAHNYIPSQRGTLCKEMIIKLAREGRKYGIYLCFITQRPRYFDQTAFSQTSNKIIFGMSHPDDIKYSLDDSIYYDNNFTSSIQGLLTGECIINGTAYKAPLLVHIEL